MSNINDFVIENGVLIKYQGPGGDVVIPDGVTRIDDMAFTGCTSLTSVVIPEGVTSIGDEAFSHCRSLTSVVIPEGVTSIGKQAFWDCSSLTNVVIPEGVTSIGDSTFSNCKSLTSVVIPESVKSIGAWAFQYCSSLTSVVIPKSVTSIGDGAFRGCINLTSVVIPESVTSIGDWAFADCLSLASVVIPESVKSIGKEAFQYCTSLTSVVIPEGVTSIGDSAFSNCKSLTSVVIPESVKSIGKEAFQYCKSLKSAALPKSLNKIGNKAFYKCESLEDTVVPQGLEKIGDCAFRGCVALAKNSRVIINGTLFSWFNAEGEIVIPEGVKAISSVAFEKCDKMTKVVLPSTIEKIAANAFVIFVDSSDTPVSWYTKLPCFTVPEKLALKRTELPVTIANGGIESTELGCTALALFQKKIKAWDKWRESRKIDDPAEELDRMISLLEPPTALEPKTAAPVATFILKYYETLEPLHIRRLLNLYKDVDCPEIAALSKESRLMKKLEGESSNCASHPMEKLAVEKLKEIGAADNIDDALNVDMHWEDPRHPCSREALNAVFSFFALEWNRVASVAGLYNTEYLKDGTKLRIDPEIDMIACSFDRDELNAHLNTLLSKPGYRKYILAWARYANESDVARKAGSIAYKKRGNSKERYLGINIEQSLYLSDTVAAMHYFEDVGMLDNYARMRNTTAQKLRNTAMIPQLGFDADGARRFDIGGSIIEARLTDDLKFALTDASKGKQIRSFPKKSADLERAEAAAEEYTAFKKSVTEFAKYRTLVLKRMHMSGEMVEQEDFETVYMEHPVVSRLTKRVIWMDENGKCFMTSGRDYTDEFGNAVVPKGRLRVAHILDMREESIEAWRKKLIDSGVSQLFEQIWEPKADFASKPLSLRYNGCRLSEKARNELKRRLNERSVTVRSGEMIKQYDYRNQKWDFSQNNTMYLGSSLKVEYTVDPSTKEIALNKVACMPCVGRRELNAVVFELDRACVFYRIEKDDPSTVEMLPYFTAAQITEFIETARRTGANTMLAELLEYKNNTYPYIDAETEFMLEW
jgi:hypothetical protein